MLIATDTSKKYLPEYLYTFPKHQRSTHEREEMDTQTRLPQSRLAVPDEVDESAFFTLADGTPTLAGHGDLEAAVPNEEKSALEELERYWVNEPFAFVVIYKNTTQQEFRYYLVEPSLTESERALVEFFGDKLKLSIDYSTVSADATPRDRAEVVRDETIRLMNRYNLLEGDFTPDHSGLSDRVKEGVISLLRKRAEKQARNDETVDPVPVERDPETGKRKALSDRQVEKIIYYLVRNFIRYDRIDGLKHDVNVEDISCDGYNEPVFVYHGTYGQVLTNVEFAQTELDEFVIKLAQRARKGISKRQPNVDATLADGSRAQLTLGREVSDRGTNFTIRQFRDVPFTPVDLITWGTYSLSQMVYLWLAIESGKSLVIAGGTASGKTTTLNALSLFIPSDSKIVSIEDTRELLIPQRNWVANTTRESFQADGSSDIDEFDLLEDSLRQRPDYIIMGEVRGEEGRTLFQAMNTGHTVCTTFHANSPEQVIRRFTQEPINVASSMFGAVDIVANQTSTKVDGRRVRRATSIVEIDSYDANADEFVVDETYAWDSIADEIRANTTGATDLMEQVRRDNGWSQTELERERQRREVLLAALIRDGITTYAGVAATIQAYMHSPDLIMRLVSNGELRGRIDHLTRMRTVNIDIDDEVEALVPRPTPDATLREQVEGVVADGEELLSEYEESEHPQMRPQPQSENDSATREIADQPGRPPEGATNGMQSVTGERGTPLPEDNAQQDRTRMGHETPAQNASPWPSQQPSDTPRSAPDIDHPPEGSETVPAHPTDEQESTPIQKRQPEHPPEENPEQIDAENQPSEKRLPEVAESPEDVEFSLGLNDEES